MRPLRGQPDWQSRRTDVLSRHRRTRARGVLGCRRSAKIVSSLHSSTSVCWYIQNAIRGQKRSTEVGRGHVGVFCCRAVEQQREARSRAVSTAAKTRQKAKRSYQVAAIAASTLVISMAIVAITYRISWHHQADGSVLTSAAGELASTLVLVLGGMVGMEMYARYVHRYLWHENEVGWALHKSHHEPRVGPFEANDVYAVMNAVPAIGLCWYGFQRPDAVGGVCFGLGLGITLFGISYMFVHDGLVHKRFPVGPVANVPWLRRVAVAHQMHHCDSYGGVPFGMFLGPLEVKEAGYEEEFERLLLASQSSSGERERRERELQ